MFFSPLYQPLFISNCLRSGRGGRAILELITAAAVAKVRNLFVIQVELIQMCEWILDSKSLHFTTLCWKNNNTFPVYLKPQQNPSNIKTLTLLHNIPS